MSLSNLGLDAFYLVYQYKTVVTASKHLSISPTGVTQRIRGLKRELKTSLFLRTKKGMIPTEAGEKLAAYCKSKERIEQSALREIRGEGLLNPVRLSIAASTYFMYSQILPIAEKLSKTYPALYFSFDVNDDHSKIERLKKNQTDLIVLPRELVPLELDSKLLGKRKYILAGGKNFKRSKREFTILDFTQEDPFTDAFFRKLKIKYNTSKPRHFVNNTMMMPRLIEAGLGVAVLDETHYRQIKREFKIFNLYPDKFYEIEWALAWMPRLEMPDYFQATINAISRS